MQSNSNQDLSFNFINNGKGLFVFSDPGGAKPVLALISLQRIKNHLVISDRNYDFYNDFQIDVKQYEDDMELKVFQKDKFDFLYTGTSYTSKIELKFIQQARMNNIHSWSFIDHYTNFEQRFEYNGYFVFPDTICLTDEKAYNIGLSTRLPHEKLFITGNYYHKWLESFWKPKLDKNQLFDLLNIAKTTKLIIYAPDPLSNVGGIDKYGFDEISIFKILLDGLKNYSSEKFTLLLKVHPNQNLSLFKNIPIECYKIVSNDFIDTNSLLYHSSIIIGMFSNILVEASIMQKRVIRILIGLKVIDPFESNDVGVIINTIEDLDTILRNTFEI